MPTKDAIASGSQKIYDGRCGQLSAEDQAEKESAGMSSVIRVRMPDEGMIRWTDLVHGDMAFECAVLDDWVAVKSDGFPTNNFACVVDDGLMQISHVLRGDDHLSNPPRQVHLFKELGFTVPKFGHMPMILGEDKRRLSKRHGAASVEDFRDAGYLPQALMNYLAMLGWNPGNDQEVFETPALIKAFSLKRLNNTAAVFDPEKCKYINAEHMKKLSDKERSERAWPLLVAAGLVEEGDTAAGTKLNAVVKIMGARLGFLGDVPERFACYLSDEYPRDAEAAKSLTPEAIEQLSALADRYEALDSFEAASAETAMRAYAEEVGVKLGALVHPARYAISGQKVGPSLFDAMEVMGPDTVLKRMRDPK